MFPGGGVKRWGSQETRRGDGAVGSGVATMPGSGEEGALPYRPLLPSVLSPRFSESKNQLCQLLLLPQPGGSQQPPFHLQSGVWAGLSTIKPWFLCLFSHALSRRRGDWNIYFLVAKVNNMTNALPFQRASQFTHHFVHVRSFSPCSPGK